MKRRRERDTYKQWDDSKSQRVKRANKSVYDAHWIQKMEKFREMSESVCRFLQRSHKHTVHLLYSLYLFTRYVQNLRSVKMCKIQTKWTRKIGKSPQRCGADFVILLIFHCIFPTCLINIFMQSTNSHARISFSF